MDAPCRGLIVLAQVEAAVLGDPAAREQSLSCVTKKLPPVPNIHGQPNTSTPGNMGMWQGIAFGLPKSQLAGGLVEGSSGSTCNSWGSMGSGTLLSVWHCHPCVMLVRTARPKAGPPGSFCSPSACPGTVSASLALLRLKQEPSPCSSHAPAPYR